MITIKLGETEDFEYSVYQADTKRYCVTVQCKILKKLNLPESSKSGWGDNIIEALNDCAWSDIIPRGDHSWLLV